MLIVLAFACFGTTAGPCADYCDYICECHADDGEVSCDDCRVIYTDDDAAVQDECETALVDLQNADRDAGYECADDSGA